MGCSRLCSANFSAGTGLQCRRICHPSHGVLTPLFCELQRWGWSTVPQNMPPQLGAAAPFHTKKLDVALSDTLRIISGCLKPTRRELLPVLPGIPPSHMCREHSTLQLAFQAQLNTNHPLHALVRSVVSWHTAPAFTTPLPPPCCSANQLRLQYPGVMESGMGKCHATGPVFGHPCRLSPVWLRATPQSVGSTE